MNQILRPIALLSLILAGFARGQDEKKDPTFGHSYHGEVFNEGPRQAAVLIPGTGDVHLEVTTDSEEAQRFFDQGIGQLHGFWDFEAERTFRQVATIDPDCAMAYWGMAMANFKNDKRGKPFAEEAKERRGNASERERRWIDALAKYFDDPKADLKKRLRDYVRALEDIAIDYPDDIEAQAFLMKQIYYNHGKGHAIPSHYAVNLLAEKILTADPDHPANHYRIHLWDREKPARALEAAANCGPAAPGIAHMWHMPGHIYSRLHRYRDAVWQQEASARVDHDHMIRYRIVPDRIHNFAHNNEWCIRNLNFLGDLDRSVELAANMISLPRVAKFKDKDDASTYDPKGSSWAYGRQRLRDTLVRFEQWERLLELAGPEEGMLHPDGKSILQRDHDRFLGIARIESGDSAGAEPHLASLRSALEKKQGERDKAVAEAEKKAKDAGKAEKEIKTAKGEAEKKFKGDIETLESFVNEITIYRHLAADPPETEAAKALLPELKSVAKWRHAALWHRAGDEEKALELSGKAVDEGEGEVLPLAIRVRVLHAAGKSDEARKAFDTLRPLAIDANLDCPPVAALAPVAKEFGFPADWRVEPDPADDLGERPDLDSLGPFRWTPPAAPGFALPDARGKVTSLDDFGGRAVLVIHYLGRECSHCMDQLNAFAPLHQAYAEAGIDIVAVSPDSIDKIAKTFRNPGEDGTDSAPFPFPLLSDESLDSFKAWRAFDDFEDMALHGTYLVDAAGRIRWQEISYEPFMHPAWLLEECRRLLAMDDPES